MHFTDRIIRYSLYKWHGKENNLARDPICLWLRSLYGYWLTRLAIDRSICILTRPVVNTGFNRSLLVDWWSIGRLKKTWSMRRYLALVIPFYWTL